MVDAVDLRLPEDPEHLAIQLARRVEVPAEGLLDDDPAPATVVLLVVQAAAPDLAHDRRERGGLRGQVEQQVVGRRLLGVHVFEPRRQAVVHGVIGEVTTVVDDAVQELPLGGLVELHPAVLVERLGEVQPERVVVVRPAPDRHQRPVGRQQVRAPQLRERGNDLAVRQVPGGPEQHHDVRVRHPLQAQALAERVDLVVGGRALALAVPGQPLLAERLRGRGRGGLAHAARELLMPPAALRRLHGVAAELVPERGEDLRAVRVLLARAEAREQGEGDDRRRDREAEILGRWTAAGAILAFLINVTVEVL